MMRRPSSIGWSLAELLVAIAVVATVAILLLPVGSRILEAGRSTRCLSNLRQLGAGFLAYFGEHGGKFPVYPASNEPAAAWPWLISPYVGYDREKLTPAVFVCPSGIKHPAFPMSALRGYSMNLYVSDPAFANNTLSNGPQALLLEEWAAPTGTDRDHVMWPVLGGRRNKTYLSYSDAGNKERLAWRHRGEMNILTKEGGVTQSGPGRSGWGETILWRAWADGRQWRDGHLQ
ncbi:MAG TPA: hypothetical protein VNQ90_11165 [Chthoniobacteraceae bacterium]|nr:hypothetical protein [Chthoniobacteraceae bacterium]